ncbi:MAG: hypothetical protein ACXWTY_12760 [Methylobacter sp.]
MIETFYSITHFFENAYYVFMGIVVFTQTLWALACIVLSGTENLNPATWPTLFLNTLLVAVPTLATASWLAGHHPVWGILAVALVSLLALKCGVWHEIVKDIMYFTDKNREGNMVRGKMRVVEATLIVEPRTAKNDATWTALKLLPSPQKAIKAPDSEV